MTKESKVSAYRFKSKTINMLGKLVAHENAKVTNKKNNVVYNERELVERAIETLYYQTFSDNVMQAIMPRIWSEVSNKTSIMIEPLVLRFAQVLNLITATEEVNREMIAVLMRQAGFDIEPLYRPNNIYNLTVEDEIIFDTFNAAIDKKRREQICSQGENHEQE
ncbi:hypothetical protein G7059_00015 [Erysipelothrix sp. HDW6A]|uniref:hypothetical protein n=1 Tax=Erysipelothrix sp. HDW6A TaxID=2714928 RepID=UPI00140AA9E7|nr:hypothetical protein [Erysipelothrix sp. HDW6A]QIK56339.1 hypothetical protein G7059_00015 [Erysipelothrix sp. HDW6A]